MSETEICQAASPPIPLPDNIGSVQPGSGTCYRLELAWGRCRRWYLKKFRAGYVRRMASLRKGNADGAPHEILDPRDLKYCCNLCDAEWSESDDPFAWRSRLPLARWGLAELQIMGYPLLALTLAAVWLPGAWRWLGIVPACLFLLVLYFFRDPRRLVPEGSGRLVAPADGRVVEITRIDHDEFIGGPAIRIGIFLSIFNVHINRLPERSRVIELRYKPGEFLNAMNPESALRNEAMWIGLEEAVQPNHRMSGRRMIVRQISGLIARRIVCTLRPGQVVERGAQFGMIKLGSRTELILDADGADVRVMCGQHVKGGETVLAVHP